MADTSCPTTCITSFSGGNALTVFRQQQLLRGVQAHVPAVRSISACFVHWVQSTAPLDEASTQALQELLTYGEPYALPPQAVSEAPHHAASSSHRA